MKCQKCGKEITEIEANVFDCFGNDSFVKKQIEEIAEYGIAELRHWG